MVLTADCFTCSALRGGSPGFSRSDFSLYPVGLETWGGFFFLNLSPGEPPETYRTLPQQLGEIISRVQHLPPLSAILRAVKTVTYDVQANWKAIVEKLQRCYHCGGLHPELCEIVPAFRQQGGAQLDWERGIPHREELFHILHSAAPYLRAPFPGLDEGEKVRHKGELIYPNFMLSLAADHSGRFSVVAERARGNPDNLSFFTTTMTK